MGSLIGKLTKDKNESIPVQLPSGRILDVSAADIQRAHEQEASRFQDMVERSQNGRYR